MTMSKYMRALGLAALAAALGCDHKSAATPANYTLGINKYLSERPLCLLPGARFPYSTSDLEEAKRMDTLVEAQLLKVFRENAVHASRYVATDLGAKYAPHFCYGYPSVSSIDSSTPPAVANGFNETQVTYHYVVKDIPVWAKSEKVKAAFPEMARKTSGEATEKVTLAQTRMGWSVPD